MNINVEDRVIANLSRDANKCSIFLDGVDGHCLNSYVYFKEEVEAELPRLENETDTEYLKRYYVEVEKGNKVLKAIRQKSKPCTFLLAYGGYPDKLAKNAKIPIEKAKEIFNNYHTVLYKGITEMRDKVLEQTIANGRINLGLGCYMSSSNPEKEIRTLFNACSQFWSILTLLTINKMHSLIDANGYTDDIQVVATIYDSIYINMKEDATLIEWVNNNIIPLLTANFIKDIIVHNEAEGEIGYDWATTLKVPNNASSVEISNITNKLKENINDS